MLHDFPLIWLIGSNCVMLIGLVLSACKVDTPGAPDTGGFVSLSQVKKIRHVHCYCFWQWFQRSGTALHFSVLNYGCTVSLYRCYNEPGDLFTTCVQLLDTFLSIFNKQGISLHPTKLPIISFFCLISLMHDVCLFLFRDYTFTLVGAMQCSFVNTSKHRCALR